MYVVFEKPITTTGHSLNPLLDLHFSPTSMFEVSVKQKSLWLKEVRRTHSPSCPSSYCSFLYTVPVITLESPPNQCPTPIQNFLQQRQDERVMTSKLLIVEKIIGFPCIVDCQHLRAAAVLALSEHGMALCLVKVVSKGLEN